MCIYFRYGCVLLLHKCPWLSLCGSDGQNGVGLFRPAVHSHAFHICFQGWHKVCVSSPRGWEQAASKCRLLGNPQRVQLQAASAGSSCHVRRKSRSFFSQMEEEPLLEFLHTFSCVAAVIKYTFDRLSLPSGDASFYVVKQMHSSPSSSFHLLFPSPRSGFLKSECPAAALCWPSVKHYECSLASRSAARLKEQEVAAGAVSQHDTPQPKRRRTTAGGDAHHILYVLFFCFCQ